MSFEREVRIYNGLRRPGLRILFLTAMDVLDLIRFGRTS